MAYANRLHILLVDDDDELRAAVRLVLAREAIAVSEARHGGEALVLLDGELRFDAIVLDLNMPAMDGPTLLRRLRSDPRHARLPVVVITGERSAQAADLGVEVLLPKPVGARQLAATLRALARMRGPSGSEPTA